MTEFLFIVAVLFIVAYVWGRMERNWEWMRLGEMKNYTEEYLNMVNAEPPNSTERREILQGYRKENVRLREDNKRLRIEVGELQLADEQTRRNLEAKLARYEKAMREIKRSSQCPLWIHNALRAELEGALVGRTREEREKDLPEHWSQY